MNKVFEDLFQANTKILLQMYDYTKKEKPTLQDLYKLQELYNNLKFEFDYILEREEIKLYE